MKKYLYLTGLLLVGISLTEGFIFSNLLQPGFIPGISQTIQSAFESTKLRFEDAAKEGDLNVTKAIIDVLYFAKMLYAEIDETTKNAREQLNEKIQSLGPKVQQCMEENDNPIRVGIETAQNKAQECVQSEVNAAINIGVDTVQDIKMAYNSLASLRGNLENCKLVTKPITCVTSVIRDANYKSLLLPINLAKHVAEAVSLIEGLKGRAMVCVSDMIAKTTLNTAKTSLAITKCTANL